MSPTPGCGHVSQIPVDAELLATDLLCRETEEPARRGARTATARRRRRYAVARSRDCHKSTAVTLTQSDGHKFMAVTFEACDAAIERGRNSATRRAYGD